MTYKTSIMLTLALIVVLLTACAPSATQTANPVSTAILEPTSTPFQPAISTEVPATLDPGVAPTPTLASLPAATSRGPDLHATDPTTVSLASGQYQFVEFFRFT